MIVAVPVGISVATSVDVGGGVCEGVAVPVNAGSLTAENVGLIVVWLLES